MAKVTSFALGKMSLWISKMTITDWNNVVADIRNFLFDEAKLS